MKKRKKRVTIVIISILSFFILICIIGYIKLSTIYEPTLYQDIEIPSESGLLIQTEQQKYTKGDDINVIFENKSNKNIYCGMQCVLEYQFNGKWYKYDAPDADLKSLLLLPYESQTKKAFAKIPDSLFTFSGKYRLVTNNTYVEFTVE